jgi:DNA primase catalytic core, N-terminal domain
VLWESEVGGGVRARLERHGIEESTLPGFRVGYAPGDTSRLLGHLGQWDYSEAELTAAGIASHSDRERLHVLFHARIMFPIRDAEGRVLGFAGLGTHLGPSWPLWLTSPEGETFRTGAAIFAIGEAAGAIARAGWALIVRDPVQVLALHQRGRREAVAVIHSPITRAHLTQLAAALRVRSRDLHLARRDGRLGVVAAPAGAAVPDAAFSRRDLPAGFSLIDSGRPMDRNEPTTPASPSRAEVQETPPPARAAVYLAGGLIGTGIPIGALLLASPHNEAAQGWTPALNLVVGGVAAAYLVLALAVARISARVRSRSTARRMRFPWVRGSDEVQPAGWTYHRLEEILVGAALVSAITCVVLLMTLGGFLG